MFQEIILSYMMPDTLNSGKYVCKLLQNYVVPSSPKREDIYGAIIKCSHTGRYVLVLGREAMKWSFPKGHLRKGETAFKCLIREVYEETGFIDLPAPTIRRQLWVGEYYEFIVPEEFPIQPVDTNEIVEGKWMSLHDIRLILMNVDTSHYFRELGIIPLEITSTIEDSSIGHLIDMVRTEDTDTEISSQKTEDPC